MKGPHTLRITPRETGAALPSALKSRLTSQYKLPSVPWPWSTVYLRPHAHWGATPHTQIVILFFYNFKARDEAAQVPRVEAAGFSPRGHLRRGRVALSRVYDPRQMGHAAQDVRAQGEPFQRVPRPDVQAEPVDDILQVHQLPFLTDEMM